MHSPISYLSKFEKIKDKFYFKSIYINKFKNVTDKYGNLYKHFIGITYILRLYFYVFD